MDTMALIGTIIAIPFIALAVGLLIGVADNFLNFTEQRIAEKGTEQQKQTMKNIQGDWETTKDLYDIADNINTVKDVKDALKP